MAGEMLRPQNSRDSRVGYFNHEEEAPKILHWGKQMGGGQMGGGQMGGGQMGGGQMGGGQMGGGQMGQSVQPVKNIVNRQPTAPTQQTDGDVNLMKYSQMYQKNNKFIN